MAAQKITPNPFEILEVEISELEVSKWDAVKLTTALFIDFPSIDRDPPLAYRFEARRLLAAQSLQSWIPTKTAHESSETTRAPFVLADFGPLHFQLVGSP